MRDNQSTPEDDALRSRISEKLKAGLKTDAFPRAETSEDFARIVDRLRSEAADNLDAKLILSGVTNYTVELDDFEQPCETCMYYLVHRKFCDLPELMLPVEPDWSCRLWRI